MTRRQGASRVHLAALFECCLELQGAGSNMANSKQLCGGSSQQVGQPTGLGFNFRSDPQQPDQKSALPLEVLWSFLGAAELGQAAACGWCLITGRSSSTHAWISPVACTNVRRCAFTRARRQEGTWWWQYSTRQSVATQVLAEQVAAPHASSMQLWHSSHSCMLH